MEEVVEPERELVTASAPVTNFSRRAPVASAERTPVVAVKETGTALVATAGFREDYPGPLGPSDLAHVQHSAMQEHGPAEKNGKKTFIDGPHGRAVFDGPRVKTARADFGFDSDRTLTGGDDDIEKIRNVAPRVRHVLRSSRAGTAERHWSHPVVSAPRSPRSTRCRTSRPRRSRCGTRFPSSAQHAVA